MDIFLPKGHIMHHLELVFAGHHNVLVGLPLSGRSVRSRHGRHSRGGKGHHRHHKGKHLKAPEEEHRPGEVWKRGGGFCGITD